MLIDLVHARSAVRWAILNTFDSSRSKPIECTPY